MRDKSDEQAGKLGPVITCYVDRNGVIVKTSSRFEGGKPEQFIGLTLADFIEEPSRTEYMRLLKGAIERGEVGSYPCSVRSESGLSQWQVRCSPWRENGKIIGVVMVGNQLLD
jgi:PAS domain S-box-containing protein